MAKRSHQVLQEYIEIVQDAKIRKNITQKVICERLGCSRSTVSKFFNGKKVDCDLFVKICKIIDVDWQEVTGLSRVGNAHLTESEQQEPEIDISSLVNKFREQVKEDIKTRCGKMRVLDMSQPVDLNNIYTKVNILEKIISRRRKGIDKLIGNCDLDSFNRFNLGKVEEEKIPGKKAVNKYRNLLILGKPGAGKTTFLKHLVIQCINGLFQSDLVPFFISLKDFAEAENKPGLLSYLAQYIKSKDSEELQPVVEQGKILICLDGLDEVLKEDSQRIIKEIRDLSANFPHNQYVLTCRIAAKEYIFEKFTEVEIADFDWEQITIFATNWFKNKLVKPEFFLTRLDKDKPIQELASNPLLLTLLCLVFEESGDFPENRAGLYKEGLDALLKKWDAKRGIKRDAVYQKLWVQRKEDLLSKIAWDTFEPGEYFFNQDKVERYIGEYIRNLPSANTDEAALKLDSEVVLKSIESQHGLLVERAKKIYSFSHLTFQEYFTAREIIQVRQSSNKALEKLVNCLFDKRWREVFLLAVAMSPNGGKLVLLMKKKIDDLLAENKKLQQYLHWLNDKTIAEDINFRSNDIQKIQDKIHFYVNKKRPLSRSLYFSLSFSSFFLSRFLNLNLYLYLYISRSYSHSLSLDLDLYFSLSYSQFHSPSLSLYSNTGLHQALQKLKNQLPNEENEEEFKQWWRTNGGTWRENLRAIMINNRNIGHDWQFSKEQKELLTKYYRTNQLLTQCLHQECYVSPEVRQEIEETLLLPIDIIRSRQSSSLSIN